MGVEVAYVGMDGSGVRRPLPEVWAAPFEYALPARAVAHWALAESWRPAQPALDDTPGRVRGSLPSLAATRLARYE
ncbi:hypothetical protein [Streptomyces rimosus]|uniref:hypothetical protein n=1 Tax=Streptomyces rimosus TaxID=1927 RepID=UPI0004BFBECA|nr:hypothetical protein [Streptomyces rimosus]